jgi:hypothetical protein
MNAPAIATLVSASNWVDPSRPDRARARLGPIIHVILSVLTVSPGQGWSAIRVRPVLAKRIERIQAGRKETVKVAVGRLVGLGMKRATFDGLSEDRRRTNQTIHWGDVEILGPAERAPSDPGDGDTLAMAVRIGGRRETIYGNLQDLALLSVLCGQPFARATWGPSPASE